MAINDELAAILAKSLNEENKEQKVAYFLDGEDDDDAPTNVRGWISTGSSMLDLAISNRPHGGIPIGRITEISGLEQTGKSLICAHILKETQDAGGVAVLIDTEASVSKEFFMAVGVDVPKMVYVAVDTVEDIFAAIEKIVETVRATNKDRPVTIAVDSLAAASTKQEMESEYDKDGYATGKAIIISKAFRKLTNVIARQRIALVFTNQLRQKMGVMFGDPWTTSGGKAIQFHSSVRIRLKKLNTIKVKERGVDRIIGVRVKATMVKNRVGPPMRSADFDIFYDSGIDDYGGWFLTLKHEKLVTASGAWYTFKDGDGKEHKFQAKTFVDQLEKDSKLKEAIYQKICNTLIMKYRNDKTLRDSEAISYEDESEDA